jgi:hypothetical protein
MTRRFSVGGYPCAVSEKTEKKSKRKRRRRRVRREEEKDNAETQSARRLAERRVSLYASQPAWFR